MALPQAIQAQVEQAETLLAEANKAREPQADLATLADQPTASAEQEPQPQAATPPAQEPQPPQQDPWEQRYKTLQGRYNHDVPNLQSKVKELETQLTQAVQKMQEVAKPQEPPEKKPAADPQDVEAFGADLVDMVQRVAERMFGGAARTMQEQAARLDQRMTALEQALQGTTQTVAVTAEQAFFDRLTKMVPNWEDINNNQAFLDWLQEVDPVYGQPRQAALNFAQQQLNAERAANVFKAFAGTVPQAPKANPVEKQVSPKAAASSAPTSTEKPVITQKQVTDFYNDVARGMYRGRDAEAARIEAMINSAMSEGRIR